MKSLFFTLIFIVGASFVFGQGVGYTAKDAVTSYDGLFHPGSNLGYFPPWSNQQLGDLAAGNPAVGVMGIGAKSIRPALFGTILDNPAFGYEASLNDFQHYASLGLEDLTCIVGFPPFWLQDQSNYCEDGPFSELYRNMYLPIWDNGENGTPINDENYFANYLYQVIQVYGDQVTFWEIWNEPGFDFTGNLGWRGPGDPVGNWWDNNPDPCDYKLRAPIFHYVRMLRISWELIKTYDPDGLVTVAGLGYESFLDAVMRNTDNPNDGSVTAEYPHGGGAYFDCMGFHSYPHFDGSTITYDSGISDFIYRRHSDGAANGITRRRDLRQGVLDTYGYDGITYPKKEWIITEINIPRQQFGEYLGSEEAQINFMMKAVSTCMMEDINQMHVYNLSDRTTEAEATNEFDILGLYQKLENTPPYTQVMNPAGLAYKTTSDFLYGTRFDQGRTNQMNLPTGVKGGAFRNDATGNYTYMIWAETLIDQSEFAQANYSFPASLGISEFTRYEWNHAQTMGSSVINSMGIQLTGRPIILRAVGDEPPVASADLSLNVSSSAATVVDGDQLTVTITVNNTGPDAADGVSVKYALAAGLNFASASSADYNSNTGIWTIGTMNSGQTATLTVTLNVSGLTSTASNFAQIQSSSASDVDSTPGNDTNNSVNEDDEGSSPVSPLGGPTCNISFATVNSTCANQGSPSSADDTYTFTLDVGGSGLSGGFNVSGDVTASNIPYGSPQPIPGVYPIGTQLTLTLTDSADPSCAYTFNVDSPFPCSDTTPQEGVDLSLSLNVNNPSPGIYSEVVYTLTVSNSGSATATDVEVNFPVSNGLAFVSQNVSSGTYFDWTGDWYVGSIPAGGSQTLTLTLFTLTGDAIGSYAQVTAQGQTDADSTPNNNPGPTPNEDDEEAISINGGIQPPSCSISNANAVTTCSDAGSPVINDDTFTFTLNPTGNGTSGSYNVSGDVTMMGVPYGSPQQVGGSFPIANGNLNITITDAADASCSLSTSIAAPAPCSINPSSSVDLELNMSVSDASYDIYENVNYTLTVNNAGTDPATDIVISFPKPAGMAFVAQNLTTGVYYDWTGEWFIDQLNGGGSATMELTLFTLVGDTPITAFAQVLDQFEADADSTPGNNSGTVPAEDDEASTTIFPGSQLRHLLSEEDKPLRKNLHAYPNPAENELNVIFNSEIVGNVVIDLYDIRGTKIKSINYGAGMGKNNVNLDISEMHSGMYHILISGASNEIKKLRFVKQRL